jgi:MFS superfamily sulfate permease-like transporter
VNYIVCAVVQVSGVISAIVVMIVILALGPLFYSLPKALLAMIIIVALFPLFKQFRELKVYWKVIYHPNAQSSFPLPFW